MNRVITVKGTGRASAKPDQVVLKMNLNTTHEDYLECMKLADSRCAALQNLLKTRISNFFHPVPAAAADNNCCGW